QHDRRGQRGEQHARPDQAAEQACAVSSIGVRLRHGRRYYREWGRGRNARAPGFRWSKPGARLFYGQKGQPAANAPSELKTSPTLIVPCLSAVLVSGPPASRLENLPAWKL